MLLLLLLLLLLLPCSFCSCCWPRHRECAGPPNSAPRLSKLFEATTDDDGKVPDTVSKPICKAAIKAKEPALQDMGKWLVDRLRNNESSKVKIKVIRVVMQMIASPKASRFGEIFKELGLDEISLTTEYTCDPDPVHGDKPQEFVRSLAVKCLMALQAFEGPAAAGGGGGGGGMMERAKAAKESARAKVEAAAGEAKAKVQEAADAAGAAAQSAVNTAQHAIETAGDGTPSPLKPWSPAGAPNGPTHVMVRWAMPPADLDEDGQLGFDVEYRRNLKWNPVECTVEESETAGRAQWTTSVDNLEPDKKYSVRVRVRAEETLGPWSEPSEPIATAALEPVAGGGADQDGEDGPDGPETPLSKSSTKRAQLDLGSSIEPTVESRSKLMYEIQLEPSDYEVEWCITLAALDLAIGVTFTVEGARPRVVDGWELTKQEAGTMTGSYTATAAGVLTIELDNSYSRMRAKTAQLAVKSVGAGITVVPCRWDMGQGEWDPFLQKALASPSFVELPAFKVQVQPGVTWDAVIDSIQQNLPEGLAEITIVGSSTRRGAAFVQLEFPGDEHLSVLNCGAEDAGCGADRSRVLSDQEIDKLDGVGSCGLFSRETPTLCSSDEVPVELLTGASIVQLQLPATGAAWQHFESESQPAAEAGGGDGTQKIAIIDTKVEDGKTFYQISWTDKRGRTHVVWKRYSRFDTLRTELTKLKKDVKDLPFPKKKKLGSKKDKTVDARVEMLQLFLEKLVIEEVVAPHPWEDDGKVLFEFLTGESDL